MPKRSLRGAISGILLTAAALCFGLLLVALKIGGGEDVPLTNDPRPFTALLIILGVALAAIIAVLVSKAVSAKRAKQNSQPPEENPEEKTEE